MRKKITQTVHALRAQPQKTRQMLLVSISFGLTGLIVILWLFSFAVTDRIPDTAAPLQDNTQSPFSIIKDSVVELYNAPNTGN